MTGTTKFILSVIRVFPEIVMALIFIKAVGPGSFSGVLALGIHSVGMLGKLFVEDIESLDFTSVESLKASGANKTKDISICCYTTNITVIFIINSVSF